MSKKVKFKTVENPRKRISGFIDSDLADALKAYTLTRRITQRQVLEGAIRKFIFPNDTWEATIAQENRKITNKLNKYNHKLELLFELLTQFSFTFFTHNPPLPLNQKESSMSSARVRTEQLIKLIYKKVSSTVVNIENEPNYTFEAGEDAFSHD